MNAITLESGGARPSQAIHRPAGIGAGVSLHPVASALSMVAGIVSFAVAVIALRFALVVGQGVMPRPFAMGLAIATALVGILAFWCASTLDRRPATGAAAR